MKSKNDKNILTGLIWTLVEKAGNIIFQFITLIWLARLLDPHDFGLYGIIFIFIAISEMLVDSGLGGAIMRKKDIAEIDYSTLFLFNLVMSIILYLVLFFSSDCISHFFNQPIISKLIRISSIAIIICALNIVQGIKLNKNFKFKTISVITLISCFFASFFSILIAYLGYGVWSLVALHILQILFSSLGYMFVNRYMPSFMFCLKSFKEQFSFGIFLLLSNLTKTISHNIYASIIGKTFSVSDTGYYIQANKISSVFLNVSVGIIDRTIFPVLSQINNCMEQKRIIVNVSRYASMIVFPIMLLISLLSKPLVILFIGEKWSDATPLLSILCISTIFVFLQTLNRNVLKSFGRSKEIFFIELFQIVCAMIFIFFTISSIFHILCGMTFVSLITAIAYMYFVERYIKYSIFNQIKDILVFIISAMLPFLLIFFIWNSFVLSNFNSNLLLQIIIIPIIYVFLYIFLLKFFKVKEWNKLEKKINLLNCHR